MSLFSFNWLLSKPIIYRCIRSILGGAKSNRILVNTYIRPKTRDKILDIGCGPGDIVEFLPPVDYWGFDMNEEYINSACERFSNKGKFFCKKVSRDAMPGNEIFDIVLACGVFHHLDNDEAAEMFELAYILLKAGGRFITLDGVYEEKQSCIKRFILSKDRGKYVRYQEEYLNIAKKYFSDIQISIRSDLGRMPYTYLVMECKK